MRRSTRGGGEAWRRFEPVPRRASTLRPATKKQPSRGRRHGRRHAPRRELRRHPGRHLGDAVQPRVRHDARADPERVDGLLHAAAPRACLGEHMLPSPEVACVQSVLEGWMAPEQYVPRARRRATPRATRAAQHERWRWRRRRRRTGARATAAVAAAGGARVNADGSTVFTLPTAEVPPTTPVTDPGVRTAILNSLKGGMAAADFDATRIFGPPATTEPDDAAAKIETDALDELYPNFRSGCDMLAPAAARGGKGGKGAHTAFSFTFVYKIDDVVTLPLLGLVHNFDPSACGRQGAADGRGELLRLHQLAAPDAPADWERVHRREGAAAARGARLSAKVPAEGVRQQDVARAGHGGHSS